MPINTSADFPTFENLPQAVKELSNKVDNLIQQLLVQSKNEHLPESDKLLNIQQAADFLSLSVPTIYSMVSKGTLPVMKCSKRLYFSQIELMEYLKSGRRKTASEIADQADEYLTKKRKIKPC